MICPNEGEGKRVYAEEKRKNICKKYIDKLVIASNGKVGH